MCIASHHCIIRYLFIHYYQRCIGYSYFIFRFMKKYIVFLATDSARIMYTFFISMPIIKIRAYFLRDSYIWNFKNFKILFKINKLKKTVWFVTCKNFVKLYTRLFISLVFEYLRGLWLGKLWKWFLVILSKYLQWVF